MSANERYRVLNEQIFAARGEDMRISIDGAEQLLTHTDSITPEAACTSVQLHLQVSPDALRGLLERRPGDRRRAGRAGGQLPVPVRQAAVARDPDHAVRAGHRHPAGRAEGAGRAAPGVVRRALDHLGVRPVRGEPPVLPRAAADLRGRGPAGGARRRRLPAAGRDEPAQRDGLPLEPAGLRAWSTAGRTCGWRTGCCRPARRSPTWWPTRRSTTAWCASLAEAQRPIWTQMSFATAAENLHEAARHGLDAQLYWPGRRRGAGGRADPAPPAAAGPRGADPLGRRPGARRPAARHHRAALPDRPDRRRLADRHGRGDHRARRRRTGRRRCGR